MVSPADPSSLITQKIVLPRFGTAGDTSGQAEMTATGSPLSTTPMAGSGLLRSSGCSTAVMCAHRR